MLAGSPRRKAKGEADRQGESSMKDRGKGEKKRKGSQKVDCANNRRLQGDISLLCFNPGHPWELGVGKSVSSTCKVEVNNSIRFFPPSGSIRT